MGTNYYRYFPMHLNDLEITKLCAEAMGTPMRVVEPQMLWPTGVMLAPAEGDFMQPYDPLHDDAQAMALVKRFGLSISWPRAQVVTVMDGLTRFAESKDYNRAICECVAKMWEVRGRK